MEEAQILAAERERIDRAFQDLSFREIEVLALVAEGKSNAQIAQALNLSEKTVGHHVSAIIAKLGFINRIEAATYAVRHHIERYRSASD
jgi:DNA-binding NarL/FixJ family response regulator